MNRKKWLVVWVSFFGTVALALTMNKVAPSILPIMEHFNISMSSAGWLTSVFSIMGMVSALPSVVILNRLGPKKTGMLALLFSIVGTIIGVCSKSIVLLMISRVIEGFGVGVIAVTASSLIAMWFPSSKRGLPMGILGSWLMVGQSAMFFSAGIIVLRFGWQGMWWLPLIVTAVVAVFYFFTVESPPKEHNYADAESENFNLMEGLKNKNLWIMVLSIACFTASCFGFATWIAPYWSEAFGWDIDRANKWVSIIYFLEIFFVIGIGWVLDRVKDRKIFGIVAFLLYACIVFYSFRMKNPALILPFALIYPVLEGTIPIVFWTIAPQAVPRSDMASVALGMLNVGINLGAIIGPPLTGAIIEAYGWKAGTIPIAVSALLGMVTLISIKLYDHSNIVTESVDLKQLYKLSPGGK